MNKKELLHLLGICEEDAYDKLLDKLTGAPGAVRIVMTPAEVQSLAGLLKRAIIEGLSRTNVPVNLERDQSALEAVTHTAYLQIVDHISQVTTACCHAKVEADAIFMATTNRDPNTGEELATNEREVN